MSVHYKFKSSLDFDTITFDGLHISVNDFRKAVVQQKRLGKTNDFELQITNAQTKEEYENDNDLIPKNTSLIISRVPQTSKKSRGDNQNQSAPAVCHVPKFDNNNLDLSQMNASEEDKIQAMMAQSTVDYDPRGYQKIRCPGQTGEVPPTYRCYKCHQTGHWIKNCPLPHSSSKKSEIRRNTGIPKSFLQEKGIEKESVTEEIVIVEKQAEVPDELLCSICKDIFRDAVMIPCCGSSFCDDCVRTALLESEENECPDCKEKGTSPGSLIPNRFLRSSVNTFKNETGYERKRKEKGVQEPVNVAENVPGPVIEKDTKVESPEKKSPVQSTIKDEIKLEQTLPKQSPEKEVDIPIKEEDQKPVKPEVKEEYSFDDTVESDSPKRQVEVVLPQRDVVHSSEVQVRTDDSFKQSTPATFSNYGPVHTELTHRSSNVDSSYSVRSDNFMRHSKHGQIVPPHMNYCNNYGNRTERYYYPREPFNMNTAPYPFLPNNRCRQMTPHSNIQPYYQGMAGTIEPGIIEDPLEAFNRIMKEKEKRKRIASDRHRSNVVKRAPRDTSPILEKRIRHRASPLNERRNRSPLRQEKPPRNSERDKNLRVHRSHYSSNKRSFSRSNSPPQRRYSKSPRRRSRSRSHPRSHSREYDTLRHDGRSSKHALQQSHRADHEKEHTRFIKKTSGRFSETRSVSDIVPKENRRHTSKLRENGNTLFDSYPKSSRKTFVESDNLQENRDTPYEFDEKRNKATASKSDEGSKSYRKIHESDGDREKQHSNLDSEMPKQEKEQKTKERKKKKDKDEKTEKKSKKEKKDKKKREKNKEDVKKHSQHGKSRKESSSALTLTGKGNEEITNMSCTTRDPFKGSNEESLDDRNETFTPDININRNMEMDKVEGQALYESRLDGENKIFKNNKSPKYGHHRDNNCSELNTPTSFVDTTPENYAGKWDNFDFSVPNSEDIKGETERDYEYDQHLFQNYPSTLRNEQFENTKNLCKKKDAPVRLQNDERRVKNEELCSDKRSEFDGRVTPRRPSPVPSEAVSSSTNNSNTGKNSQSKKRRKKSKHKKEKQYYKRSSSADSSRHSRKSASKHKKSRSDKKQKKTRRNESR